MLKNGSGAVRRKVNDVFGNTLCREDKRSLATLIYYPREKMAQILETHGRIRRTGIRSLFTVL